MPSCNLTIGQKMPLGTFKKAGPKTLYVWPVPNWPQPSGEVEPTIAYDVDIIIEQHMGEVVVTRRCALPYYGLKTQVAGDKVSVWAEYHTRQGLGTPYNWYSLRCDCQEGYHPDIHNLETFKVAITGIPVLHSPTIAGQPAIPPFCSKFRVLSDARGWFYMTSLSNVTSGPVEAWWFFCDIRDWTSIPPFAYSWNFNIDSCDPRGGASNVSRDWVTADVEFV